MGMWTARTSSARSQRLVRRNEGCGSQPRRPRPEGRHRSQRGCTRVSVRARLSHVEACPPIALSAGSRTIEPRLRSSEGFQFSSSSVGRTGHPGASMTTKEAIRIMSALADGCCPMSGRPLPPTDPCQHVEVVRALHVAMRALDRLDEQERRVRRLPEHAGAAWDSAEDQRLVDGFAAGKPVRELAVLHQRTIGAIEARLVKLGRMPPAQGQTG